MEIGRKFLKRSKELEVPKPLASYHCKLYAVQLLLESGAHLETPEAGEEIGTFLNEIEQMKPQLDQEIINDKQRAFDYMFAFASSVFSGAFEQIQAHNVKKSTVLEFRAALDFLSVLNLWPELVSERKSDIDRMVKYSKFHCARILKAYKGNEDPNDYVTPDEEIQLQTQEFKPAAEEEQDHILPSVPSDIKEEGTNDTEIVQFTEEHEIDLPSAPENIEGELGLPTAPVLIKGQKNILGLPTAPEPSPTQSHIKTDPTESQRIISKPPTEPPQKPYQKPSTTTTITTTKETEPSSGGRVMTRAEVETVWKRDEVIAMAQKKAKFAIGALNYEDIETAINELTQALNLLKEAR